MTRAEATDPRIEAVTRVLCGIEGNDPHTTDLVIYRNMARYVLKAADEATHEVSQVTRPWSPAEIAGAKAIPLPLLSWANLTPAFQNWCLGTARAVLDAAGTGLRAEIAAEPTPDCANCGHQRDRHGKREVTFGGTRLEEFCIHGYLTDVQCECTAYSVQVRGAGAGEQE